MSRRQDYRDRLRTLDQSGWSDYLRAESGLPGPRANLELAQAVGDVAEPAALDALLDTGEEYLVLCGVIGLGARLAAGAAGVEERLRGYAADPRWRVREGVATGLQRLGDADLPRLWALADRWLGDPHPLVRRAAVAGGCEPRLLRDAADAARAVAACQRATESLATRPAGERRDPDLRALRQALGYCWSVAVAADPAAGLPRFTALAGFGDPDVDWIIRENRRKTRLARLLPRL